MFGVIIADTQLGLQINFFCQFKPTSVCRLQPFCFSECFPLLPSRQLWTLYPSRILGILDKRVILIHHLFVKFIIPLSIHDVDTLLFHQNMLWVFAVRLSVNQNGIYLDHPPRQLVLCIATEPGWRGGFRRKRSRSGIF